MKTYTTSECIAILEREEIAKFEAPATPTEQGQRIDRCGPVFMFSFLHPDGEWCTDEVPRFRSDWVRTDKEEE